MENNKKISRENLFATVLLMIVVIVGISVAYAALSSTLNIQTGNVTTNSLTWNVGFAPGTVTGTSGGSGNDGRVCGDATVTANSVSIANTTLSKPEDSCTYALVINNTGSIDATLHTISQQSPTSVSCTASGNNASMECGNITYKLTTDSAGTTLLNTGGTLAKNTGTTTVFLVVKYTGATVSDTAQVQENGGFTLIYNQK